MSKPVDISKDLIWLEEMIREQESFHRKFIERNEHDLANFHLGYAEGLRVAKARIISAFKVAQQRENIIQFPLKTSW